MDTTLSDQLVGRVLDGRYLVEGRLARGGMATVYEAVDTRLDRVVAVKVMHPALAANPEFVSRFIREAKSAARLSHPDVVAVYDQGTDAGHVFLTMEYVEGRTLRDVLLEHGRLAPREALDVLQPVLAALGAAHRAGIVHRDVKPENVLLADDGRVKVADFGLARAVTSTSDNTAGVLLGTVAYLAPEQVQRGVADARSDVYAAGVMLFEMLTGRPPFDGETPLAVAYRHVHENVPPPSLWVSDVPPELDDLVALATGRDPDSRPADASKLLAEVAALNGAVSRSPSGPAYVAAGADEGRETIAVPLPRDEPPPSARSLDSGDSTEPTTASGDDRVPSWRQPRRRSRGWLGLLAVLLATALIGGTGWWLGGPASMTRTPPLLQLSRADAEAKAAAAGLRVVDGPGTFSETTPVGIVVSTDPGPGERIRKGGDITLSLSKGPERYVIPDLYDRSLEEATAELEALTLKVEVEEEFSDDVEAGHVISSDPEDGTELRRGELVTLVVSNGVEPVEVPDVTGSSRGEAEDALAEVGLEVSVEEEFSDDVDQDEVIRQDPGAGETAGAGSTVTIVVSQGPELFEVPQVVGLSQAEAVRVLEEAGFEPRVFGLPFGEDRVVAQQPGAGSERPKGDEVALSVF